MTQVNMCLWILLALTILRSAETCVPTVAPDEYYPTASLPEYTTRPMEATTTAEEEEMTTTAGVASTTAAASMCDQCNVDDIAPTTLPKDSRFITENRDPVDGCLRIWVKCQRTDAKVCNEAFLYAENPTGTHSLTDEPTPASAAGLLSCDDDGTYSYGDAKMITKLTCFFDDCL
ncbi:hypothetical protein CAEBREN_08643 [Caenorhabditis brenneri]|uniref:DUF281 domain-containing protein n=1 Tax=Caenorhabditis brenneri TaxID=135651 RepID=G0NQS8_CAEBE|nr:hypothetical protein CAEBREN_08643 [Caenorhabditis brenneri]